MTIIQVLLLVVFINALLSFFTKKTNNFYCGIIGFSGPEKSKFDLNKLKVLFFINSLLRGKDSVGYYSPINGIRKINKEYIDEVGSKDNIIDDIQPDNVLIGHVRAKTIGLNTQKNAHPWEFERIVGLHNGTLKNYNHYSSGLAKKYGIEYKDYDVDSQVLLMALDQNFETLQDKLLPALEQYEGAAALLMYNKERETIFACHDKERPLFYGYIGKSMYISSLSHPLEIIGCKDVKAFDENNVYEIKNGKIINKFAYTPQAKVEKPEILNYSADARYINYTKTLSSSYINENYEFSEKHGELVAVTPNDLLLSSFTGYYSFYNFNQKLFQNFNFRLKAKTQISVMDTLTKEYVSFNPNEDYFQIIELYGDPQSAYKEISVYCVNRKQNYRVYSSCLDVERFFPINNMYVKALTDIQYTSSGVSFCEEGEILKVTNFDQSNGKFTCKKIGSVSTAYLSPKFFVIANATEVEDYAYMHDWKLYCKLAQVEFEDDSIEYATDVSCEVEKEVVIINDPTEIIDDEDDDLFNSTTLIVDCDRFDNFIEEIKEGLDEIESSFDETKVNIKTKVEELNHYIKQYDFSTIIIG